MAKLAGANDLEKLHSLCAKTYKEQAVWFLNSFWGMLCFIIYKTLTKFFGFVLRFMYYFFYFCTNVDF